MDPFCSNGGKDFSIAGETIGGGRSVFLDTAIDGKRRCRVLWLVQPSGDMTDVLSAAFPPLLFEA